MLQVLGTSKNRSLEELQEYYRDLSRHSQRLENKAILVDDTTHMIRLNRVTKKLQVIGEEPSISRYGL